MIAQATTNSARLSLMLLAAFLIAACSSQPATRDSQHAAGRASGPQHTVGDRRDRVGARAAEIALRQVGIPYRYGGSSRSGFDCSGLVQYSYAQAGKTLPRTTGQQWASSTTVSRRGLQKGDLLFFNVDGKMAHVGLYVGDNRFVHAPSSGRSVSVESLNTPFYAGALERIARPE